MDTDTGDIYLVQTYRTGDGNRYWTYFISKNKQDIPTKKVIYRMYDKKSTALRNGFKEAIKFSLKKSKTT